MGATEDTAPIPITDSQILPVHPPWRWRLAPYRRHLFVAAILLGSGLGAALFFLTHDPAVEGAAEPSAAPTATVATPLSSTPAKPAPAATGEERTTVRTTRTQSTVKTGNTVRTVKQVTTVRSTKKRTSSSTTRRSTTRPR
jgi:hypothetical protein